ncbi:MAG: ChaN family lipoprotein [Cyanobacteria bacterium J06648_11]
MNSPFRVFIGSAIALLWLLPATAQTITSPAGAQMQREAVLADLADVDAVFLGETHTSEADHEAQLDIVKALYDRDPSLAIGLEMFQRPFQATLDRYLAGDIDEAQLRRQSEYDDRWGFDWELYAPILRFARERQIPLLALNTPTEVTSKVARKGLESLKSDERTHIPAIDTIDTEDPAYRGFIQAVFDSFHSGMGNSDGFERFFQAQVLWDETMAEAIARSLADDPERQVVVLVGQGHAIYNYGLPSRVERRAESFFDDFEQRTVILNPDGNLPSEDGAGTPIADYLWTSESP